MSPARERSCDATLVVLYISFMFLLERALDLSRSAGLSSTYWTVQRTNDCCAAQAYLQVCTPAPQKPWETSLA